MRVSVFGLGYVGLVSAACLARDGHTVIGCDSDPAKLDLLQAGHSPVVEPGVDELVAKALGSGHLRVTADTRTTVERSDVSLVCVGTPANDDGTQSQAAIRRLVVELGSAMATKHAPHLFVIRSTVVPGTVEHVIAPLIEEHSGKVAGVDFDVAFVPEFLREGSSVEDYDTPPFTVAGVENERATVLLHELYGHLPCELCVTSIRTAELLKYACNSFHALKIAFANEIGRVAAGLDVDAREVMALLCKDRQLNISAAYLRPGFAFGGPCLPKDVQALIRFAEERGVRVPLLAAILPSNEIQVDAAVAMIVGSKAVSVGLLGLAFKRGTDDLRTSPLVALAQRLVQEGLEVRIFDPQVVPARLLGANRRAALRSLPQLESMLLPSAQQLAMRCDVLVIGRDDEEIVRAVGDHSRGDQTIIDLTGPDGPVVVGGPYPRT